MIACDYCEARTRQPIPHAWRVLWLPELKAYGHACPVCCERLDNGDLAPCGQAASSRSAPEVDYAAAVVAGVVHRREPDSVVETREVDDTTALEAEVVHRDVTPPNDAPVLSHGTDAAASEVDEPVGRARRDAAAHRPPSPKLIEPAPGVEIYDRPRLPKSLRDAPSSGADVAAFVRKVGETFVPPAATRPRAAAPSVKTPSEPRAPAQRSLFGGDS